MLLTESSEYTIENVTDEGGEIEFTTAPESGAVVLILRRTTISQQTDYTEAAFPIETHEANLDKITYILQDLINGDLDGLTFDLDAVAGAISILITNSGGTDATLPDWELDKAGVFHGEITYAAPADESVTTEADGHFWLEIVA